MSPALIVALVAIGLFMLALRLRRASGIPWARVRSSDTGGWRAADQPLLSRRYRLVGKPDYLLETRAGVVPVEVKPGRRATRPYESDLMQLAAYCLLIEETTGRAPQYGLLRYATGTFRLQYTADVRESLLVLLEDMRDDRDADDVVRSHEQPARCRSCGFNIDCADRLADGGT